MSVKFLMLASTRSWILICFVGKTKSGWKIRGKLSGNEPDLTYPGWPTYQDDIRSLLLTSLASTVRPSWVGNIANKMCAALPSWWIYRMRGSRLGRFLIHLLVSSPPTDFSACWVRCTARNGQLFPFDRKRIFFLFHPPLRSRPCPVDMLVNSRRLT